MKVDDVVCLHSRRSQSNSPGEFAIVVIDAGGKMWQLAGCNDDVANTLIDIINQMKGTK